MRFLEPDEMIILIGLLFILPLIGGMRPLTAALRGRFFG
jgi:hypothetical protein